jgi:hypothetical protein
LLGHRSLRTTALYTYVSMHKVVTTRSPLDLLEPLATDANPQPPDLSPPAAGKEGAA